MRQHCRRLAQMDGYRQTEHWAGGGGVGGGQYNNGVLNITLNNCWMDLKSIYKHQIKAVFELTKQHLQLLWKKRKKNKKEAKSTLTWLATPTPSPLLHHHTQTQNFLFIQHYHNIVSVIEIWVVCGHLHNGSNSMWSECAYLVPFQNKEEARDCW